jgi:hypothetical protein
VRGTGNRVSLFWVLKKEQAMFMEINFPDGSAVELDGSMCKYWKGCGLPDYEGPIEGLPPEVLAMLLSSKAVKRKGKQW